LCAPLATAACSTYEAIRPLNIDPCITWPDDVRRCHATPINQPGVPEYDRDVGFGEVVLRLDEWAAVQKNYREMKRRLEDTQCR
jgi:hypothetical protein